MKTLFIVLAFSTTTLLATTVRAQSAGTPDRDEIAIRKTLEDSRAAFVKRDLNAFVNYFVNSPDSYFQVSSADHQVILAHGIDNIKKMVGGYMQSHSSVAPAGSFKMTALRFRINGNIAFVTSNSLDSNTNEHSQDLLVLEKTSGTWKILALTAQNYETGKRVEIN